MASRKRKACLPLLFQRKQLSLRRLCSGAAGVGALQRPRQSRYRIRTRSNPEGEGEKREFDEEPEMDVAMGRGIRNITAPRGITLTLPVRRGKLS